MKDTTLPALIAKYNRPGPRYTSYPAYPHWQGISTQEWLDHLKRSSQEVDLYIHIPYCESLCTYCGCTRTITRDKQKGDRYIEALLKEWSLYLAQFPSLSINSLHFGGGTPTFLKSEGLEKLLTALVDKNGPVKNASVELDPRVTTPEQIAVLTRFGMNRFSLGIQDFDPNVQEAINRIQSFELTQSLIECIKDVAPKDAKIEFSFDLIYGLPLQNKATITDTIQKVSLLAPDTIALYGYAHVPWRSKAQKSLEKYGLPAGEEKLALYLHSKELLQSFGYEDIGLDHFARRESELYRAFKTGELQRNFMGYTTQKSEVLLGLGASSISNTEFSYAQNEKDIERYYQRLELGEIPIVHGHQLNAKDHSVARIISEIMCQQRTELGALFEDLSPDKARALEVRMDEFSRDDIIKLEGGVLSVLPGGTPFLRNICMEFDHHLGSADRFSQTI